MDLKANCSKKQRGRAASLSVIVALLKIVSMHLVGESALFVWMGLIYMSLSSGSFPSGAARDVVGIRRGAISGNMKVSFQAARSIG